LFGSQVFNKFLIITIITFLFSSLLFIYYYDVSWTQIVEWFWWKWLCFKSWLQLQIYALRVLSAFFRVIMNLSYWNRTSLSKPIQPNTKSSQTTPQTTWPVDSFEMELFNSTKDLINQTLNEKLKQIHACTHTLELFNNSNKLKNKISSQYWVNNNNDLLHSLNTLHNLINTEENFFIYIDFNREFSSIFLMSLTHLDSIEWILNQEIYTKVDWLFKLLTKF